MLRGLVLLLLGLPAPPHPLHSSSATLTDRGGGSVALSVRIFSDDLAAVAPGGDSAAAAYVLHHVRLSGRNGQPIVLKVETITHDGELTQVSARGMANDGLAGARVQQAVLWDRYHDQVNLVRTTIGSRTTTLIFANGDPPREVT